METRPPRPRPGFKIEREVIHGVETFINVPEDAPAPPSYEALEAELDGSVFLGEKTEWTKSYAGRPAEEHRFEVYVDIRNPKKTWRRYPDGRIVRGFSVAPDPTETVEHIGPLPRKGESQIFDTVPEPPPPDPAADPFAALNRLDPVTREAVLSVMAVRR